MTDVATPRIATTDAGELTSISSIRIARNGHCARLLEQGKASYTHVGHDGSGRFRQGVFELHGCRITWSESLH
ncbi:hypothetical protein ABLY35_004516 [Escherichia coli]|nr:hypothetical protein [Escherichia coli]